MQTDSGKAYALRAPFYSPFLGGGLLTALVPVLVVQYGALVVGLGSLAIFVVILLLARVLGLYGTPVSLADNPISDVRTVEEKELQNV